MPDNNQGNYRGEQYPNDQPPLPLNYSDSLPPTIPPFMPETPGGKLYTEQKKPFNGWKLATQVLLVMVLILGSAVALLVVTRPSGSTAAVQPKSTAQPSAPTSVSTPAPQPTTTGTASLTPSAQLPGVTATSYSAIQPGPGCDTNGGIWTPQGLDNITCGTQISVNAPNIRGYLFLQLPNSKAFSPNNKIGIIGNPDGGQCIGLDEQDANTGFLAEYCGDGSWSIYTISSDGTIVQTLAKNLTSTRTNVDISLTLKGTALSFSIDNEVHPINSVSPIQPTKVAITYLRDPSGNDATTVNNFSYTVLSS